MNILIPLGGIGKRFSDYGYHNPKPLIKVLGKEIIFWLLDSLKVSDSDQIYIAYNEVLDYHNFTEIIHTKYPNIKLHPIPNTKGASETILRAIDIFNLKGKTVVLDGDTWYNEDILTTIRNIHNNSVLYFNSTNKNPIYSYIQIKDGKIVNIKEKIKISDNANSGCYVFESTDKLREKILEIGFENQNELYTSQVISKMIEDDETFIPVRIEDFYVLGTPQQIIEFSKTYKIPTKRFCFDLDNTLVTYPKVSGDYSTVEPIHHTINFLKKLKENGHTVIIYTARRMRTHGGNVGGVIADIAKTTIDTLINFDIPYDELYFGKPYAHFYIDDLMVNPKSDLNKTLGFYMENVNPRHFNSVEVKDTFIKESDDVKIKGEIEYYLWVEQNGTEEIKKLFPKLISYGEKRLELEKIDGLNFSTLYVNNILTDNDFLKMLNSIKTLHSYSETNEICYEYPNLSDKFMKRINMFDCSKFEITKTEIDELYEELLNIEKKGHNPVMIHGDAVFSNIILTKDGNIKFVDVRGVVGDKHTCFGYYLYDFAKIYQSLIGYDEVVLDKKIIKSYRDNLMKIFVEFVGRDIDDIKIVTKSLLLSLIPLHNEIDKIKKYVMIYKKV